MKKRVALVLGSGGARGYAHIGVIEEIERRGYDIACIAGCSMGAVVGGIYAAGKLDEYRNWIESLDYLDVLRLVDVSFRLGAIRGEKVFGQIRKIVGDINIEELRIPYTAVATDLTNQQEIWFQEGCLHQAMRASAAIPSLFTPVMQGSRMLVDGGLLNPLPIVPVVSAHSDLIIAVNLNATNQKQYHLPVIERPAALKGRFDSMIESLGHKLSFFRRHGDDHRHHRALLAAAFTPRRVERVHKALLHKRADPVEDLRGVSTRSITIIVRIGGNSDRKVITNEAMPMSRSNGRSSSSCDTWPPRL